MAKTVSQDYSISDINKSMDYTAVERGDYSASKATKDKGDYGGLNTTITGETNHWSDHYKDLLQDAVTDYNQDQISDLQSLASGTSLNNIFTDAQKGATGSTSALQDAIDIAKQFGPAEIASFVIGGQYSAKGDAAASAIKARDAANSPTETSAQFLTQEQGDRLLILSACGDLGYSPDETRTVLQHYVSLNDDDKRDFVQTLANTTINRTVTDATYHDQHKRRAMKKNRDEKEYFKNIQETVTAKLSNKAILALNFLKDVNNSGDHKTLGDFHDFISGRNYAAIGITDHADLILFQIKDLNKLTDEQKNQLSKIIQNLATEENSPHAAALDALRRENQLKPTLDDDSTPPALDASDEASITNGEADNAVDRLTHLVLDPNYNPSASGADTSDLIAQLNDLAKKATPAQLQSLVDQGKLKQATANYMTVLKGLSASVTTTDDLKAGLTTYIGLDDAHKVIALNTFANPRTPTPPGDVASSSNTPGFTIPDGDYDKTLQSLTNLTNALPTAVSQVGDGTTNLQSITFQDADGNTHNAADYLNGLNVMLPVDSGGNVQNSALVSALQNTKQAVDQLKADDQSLGQSTQQSVANALSQGNLPADAVNNALNNISTSGSVPSPSDVKAMGLSTDQTVDLGTLMYEVMNDRASALDSLVRGYAADVEQSNANLKTLNNLMDALRTKQGSDPNDKVNIADLEFTDADGNSQNAAAYLEQYGVSDGQTEFESQDFDNMLTRLKSKADTFTSDSQEQMTKLQATMDKYNQTVNTISSFEQKWNSMLMAIIANLK